MQEDFRAFRRFPTVEKSIAEIGPEDGRVSFIGTVIDKDEGKITVDDGSGSMEVFFENDVIKNFKTGDLVRIVGKISSEGFLSGEAVQNFSKFNLDLYKEMKSVKSKSI